MPQAPAPPASEIARAIEEVLSGPDFRRSAAGLGRILGDWVENWKMWDGILDLWRRLAEAAPADPRKLAAAAVAILATWALWRAFSWRRARPGNRGVEGGGGDARVRAPRTAEEWTGVAAARAAAGRYRQAATALYLGLLLRLDQSGALAFHASKTPGEYAEEAPAGPNGVRARRFLRAFQEMSFGPGRPTDDAYRHLETLARRAGEET